MQYDLFVRKKDNWDNRISENYEIYRDDLLKMKEYENVYIEAVVNEGGKYRGGVCDEGGTFITGFERAIGKNLDGSILESYPIDKNKVVQEYEKAVFGGVVLHIFGHILTETMARLWCVDLFPKDAQILFIKRQDKVPAYFFDFISLLGIDKSRVTIVDKVVKVKHLYIPDQSLLLHSGYRADGFLNIYKKMIKNSSKDIHTFEKLYLTRTRMICKEKDCFGEEYFEEFYRKHGYQVISTEDYSIEHQITLINNAKDIVCTGGTLSHLALFFKKGTHLTMLLRDQDAGPLRPQLLINQAQDLDCTIVDVSNNILPTTHAGGIFLIGPTKQWNEYLKKYYPEELPQEEMDWEKYIMDYLRTYATAYSANNYRLSNINNADIVNVIQSMNIVLHNKTIRRDSLNIPPKQDQIKLQKQLKAIDKELDEYKRKAYIYKNMLHDFYRSFQNANSELSKYNVNEKLSFEDYLDKGDFLIINYQVHVAKKGWLKRVTEGQIAGEEATNNGIEAISLYCNKECFYEVFAGDKWIKCTANDTFAGTVGQCMPITNIRIRIPDDTKKTILYKAYLLNSGWTPWISEGEKLVNPNKEKITAVKIICSDKVH